MIQTKISLEDAVKLLDAKYELCYVDYRDDLSDSLLEIQNVIHGEENAQENFDNKIFEAFDDQATHSAFEVIKELKRQNEEIDFSEIEDDLRMEVENRDYSDVLKQLLKNTGKQTMFYDTGLWVTGYGEDLPIYKLKSIKKKLGILLTDETHDSKIKMMCEQASYGGRLVIYFYSELDKFMNIESPINTICFSGNVSIAIIDNSNGSGDSTELPISIKLPFNAENVFIDKCISYNYTFAVCGMSSNWCDDTVVTLGHSRSKKVALPSKLNDFLDKEAKLDKVFAEGKCTPGDMKYDRHRNRIYINDFPCGNKCTDCGTFWID